MPTNETVTNSSPLLHYAPPGAWNSADPSDPLLSNYGLGGYRSTNSTGGKGRVSVSWRGSSVWIYGGYRNRLGPYQVALDGVTETFPGFTPGDTEAVEYVLFSQRDLDHSLIHSLELVNLGGDDQVLDLSFVVFQHDEGVKEARIEPSIMTSHSRSSSKTSVIVGVTIISVFSAILLCMAFFWLRQRRLRRKYVDELLPVPFLMSQHTPSVAGGSTTPSSLSRKSSVNTSTTRSHPMSRGASTHTHRSLASPVPPRTIRKAASNPTLHSFGMHPTPSRPNAVFHAHHRPRELVRYPFSDVGHGHSSSGAREHLRRSRSIAHVHWGPHSHRGDEQLHGGDRHRRYHSTRRPPSIVI